MTSQIRWCLRVINLNLPRWPLSRETSLYKNDYYYEPCLYEPRLSSVDHTEAASKRESPQLDEPDHAQRESEMLIMEFLQQTQPFHDHAYTSIFGQRFPDSRDADGGNIEEEAMSARTSAIKYSKQRFVRLLAGDCQTQKIFILTFVQI